MTGDMTSDGKQTAVALLRAAWDTFIDDQDTDYDRTDEWLRELDVFELRVAVRFLISAAVAAGESVPDFDRDHFLTMLGVGAAREESVH